MLATQKCGSSEIAKSKKAHSTASRNLIRFTRQKSLRGRPKIEKFDEQSPAYWRPDREQRVRGKTPVSTRVRSGFAQKREAPHRVRFPSPAPFRPSTTYLLRSGVTAFAQPMRMKRKIFRACPFGSRSTNRSGGAEAEAISCVTAAVAAVVAACTRWEV